MANSPSNRPTGMPPPLMDAADFIREQEARGAIANLSPLSPSEARTLESVKHGFFWGLGFWLSSIVLWALIVITLLVINLSNKGKI